MPVVLRNTRGTYLLSTHIPYSSEVYLNRLSLSQVHLYLLCVWSVDHVCSSGAYRYNIHGLDQEMCRERRGEKNAREHDWRGESCMIMMFFHFVIIFYFVIYAIIYIIIIFIFIIFSSYCMIFHTLFYIFFLFYK